MHPVLLGYFELANTYSCNYYVTRFITYYYVWLFFDDQIAYSGGFDQ